MKKLVFLFVLAITFTSCKNDAKKENSEDTVETKDGRTAKQSDGLTLLQGEFVYYADAAVLQTNSQIYGVVLNNKVNELNKQAAAFKKEPTDFVMVEVRGKITPKPANEEGWENRVEIKEILNISALNTQAENVVKLGTK
ncbi:hypothetical protein KO494_15055 [Lacinutrix sp. C3R15]|uniref:hypothetical protein n=1 Tax=Flavobacteriaceae TaxID=49546 RepID=UPI001C0904EA|nr:MULTISPECIES: hypothetical protein [Flavobacteriaceae]MBU2940866.1 hypothetical protein [Lacinutrix sp. C3R15]MDO6624184.1 hypothetical protein [Oceanihabitans sp. 1_MG-2023]